LLIFSEQHLLPVVGGIITLGGPGGYIYCHRVLYDAAVVLEDRYKTKEALVQELGTTKHGNVVEFFYENAPSPIRILAPYLAYTNEPDVLDLEHCCGFLHTISKILDLRTVPTIQPALRKTINIHVDPDESYLIQWKMLMKEWFDYAEINSLADKVTLLSKIPEAPAMPSMPMYPPMYPPYGGYQPPYPPMQSMAQVETPTAVTEEETPVQDENITVTVQDDGEVLLTIMVDENDTDLDDFEKMFFGDMIEEDPAEEVETFGAPPVQQAPTPQEEAKEEDGLAAMRNLFAGKGGNQ
jgi:hypothetical protein